MSDKEELKQVEEKALRRMIGEAAQSAAPVFAERGWRWATGDGTHMRSPGQLRIAICLQRLLDAAREVEGNVSSGRLTVARWEEDGEEHFDISLQLSEAAPE